MVVGSYISIITLTVSGLNAPTKRHGLAGAVRTCACMHFHFPHHSTWNPKLCVFYIVNHVSIIACNCNYLFFLSGYWLWKLINSFYSCGKKTKHAVFQGHSCLLLWPTLCGVFLPRPLTFWDGPQSVERFSLNKSTSYYQKKRKKERKESPEE